MQSDFKIIGEKFNVNTHLIKKVITFFIPESYLKFLAKYGYGIISTNIEYLNIIKPDKAFFINNFIEDIDLWDWKNEFQKQKMKNSFLIAHTFDGQHIYCTPHSFLILPRFEDPIEFDDFEEVIQYYIEQYKMNGSIKYLSHKG